VAAWREVCFEGVVSPERPGGLAIDVNGNAYVVTQHDRALDNQATGAGRVIVARGSMLGDTGKKNRTRCQPQDPNGKGREQSHNKSFVYGFRSGWQSPFPLSTGPKCDTPRADQASSAGINPENSTADDTDDADVN
jgi:hypothetical protein